MSWPELLHRYFVYPVKQLRRKWVNRGKTEREVYRDYIRRIWRQSQFFHDKPPSPHLRVLYDDSVIADLHEETASGPSTSPRP